MVPKEGSRRLYLNQHYDLDLGVAMCFEKRVDVKRDRSLFRKRVDVGSDRSLAFIFSGSVAVAAGQSVRRPRGSGVWGTLATPVIENLVYEKFSKEGYYRVLPQGAGGSRGYKSDPDPVPRRARRR